MAVVDWRETPEQRHRVKRLKSKGQCPIISGVVGELTSIGHLPSNGKCVTDADFYEKIMNSFPYNFKMFATSTQH